MGHRPRGEEEAGRGGAGVESDLRGRGRRGPGGGTARAGARAGAAAEDPHRAAGSLPEGVRIPSLKAGQEGGGSIGCFHLDLNYSCIVSGPLGLHSAP